MIWSIITAACLILAYILLLGQIGIIADKVEQMRRILAELMNRIDGKEKNE